MERIIKSVSKEELTPSLDFVEKVFTDSENATEARIVRNLVAEIRSNEYYLPELDLIMVNELGEIIGLALFSRMPLDGKYENELLVLTPMAVKTELQRQHISKDLIEFGFKKAAELGYKAVIVEGNPQNYNSRGFKTSADYGIFAHESVGLPAPECLMVKELYPGSLEGITGYLSYGMYESLK